MISSSYRVGSYRRLSYFRGCTCTNTPYSFGAGDAMGLQLPAGSWQQSVLQRRCLVQRTSLSSEFAVCWAFFCVCQVSSQFDQSLVA